MRRKLYNIFLSAEQVDQLQKLATASGVEVAQLIRIAIDLLGESGELAESDEASVTRKHAVRIDHPQMELLKVLNGRTGLKVRDLLSLAVDTLLRECHDDLERVKALAYKPRTKRILWNYTNRAFWCSPAIVWEKSNAEIAEQTKATVKVVSYWRRKLGKAKGASSYAYRKRQRSLLEAGFRVGA